MADCICAPAHRPVPSSAGAAGIVFAPNPWKGYARSSGGNIPASGALVNIHASERLDEVSLGMLVGGISCYIQFSAADGRAIAAELLAAAAAVDAAQGRA